MIIILKHKNTRHIVQKGTYLVKTYKKVYEKLLTKTKRGDNICKHSSRETSEGAKKVDAKKSWKNFQKSIDKNEGMWYTLKAVSERAAIGPWKLNNEIRKGTRDSMVTNHQEEFLEVLFKQ